MQFANFGQLYLVTYDIPADRRRRKTAHLLEGYGQRVQYSVFECRLDAQRYRELQKRLQHHFDLSEDHLRFYPMTEHTLGQIEVWGGAKPAQLQDLIL
ncbi:CRISPR-associated protein Cas2 [Gloeomargarita lithophora Alchichica-D10]|uniref:CRISPR-associated endoribonuclease Cas2 n=1 Tax=Gloeomargarita lithophora Alchichica-D10 TaxID=1188229 RepID=A0A1J0A974_9CYAN|nr:CRISPR-associated endonuclease Cas2 [Gloeomargarita lithophora]APB32484.1 CRISPR-associated protein Cas2 [Gloeomargarita lithophora Alchichica-D10]